MITIMTELIKGHWTSEGESIRFSMPIAKVDRQNRLVSGWATLDNVDSQGDIVTAEASRKAFARARGNLREMHQNIAVGKIVDFREDEFYNDEDGKFYRGIFVTARVSEGAQDTWVKVLDGTLSGFSIGGSIIDSSSEMHKDSSQQVRIVKDYDLVELSLVDNPANQLANVFSIQKTATGSVIKGMVADTVIENVFFCKADETVKSVTEKSADCPKCGNAMENIGWFESGDDRAEKVRNIVTKFVAPTNEGGEEMKLKDAIEKAASEENAENVEEASAVESEEVSEVEEEAPNGLEETPTAVDAVTGETSDGEVAEEVSEVEDDQEIINKRIDELKDVITNTLEKNQENTNKAVEALEGKLDEISKSFESKASELEKKFEEFGQILEVEKNRLSNLEKKLDKMNSTHAVKKSSDLEDSGEQIVQKSQSLWDGAFSVNNLR